MKTIDYVLPNWTICPLFNSDESGLTDSEQAALDNFIDLQIRLYKYDRFFAIAVKEDG